MEDILAQLDAFIADVDGWTGDKLAHFMLALAAERAIERIFRFADFAHTCSPLAATPGWNTLILWIAIAHRPHLHVYLGLNRQRAVRHAWARRTVRIST